jgi:hypothetical protein
MELRRAHPGRRVEQLAKRGLDLGGSRFPSGRVI